MSTFTLELASEDSAERIRDVVSLVAVDDSGSFGILAGHEPLVTALSYGLCRYRTSDERVYFLAIPSGIMSFADGVLHLATSRYLRDDDSSALLERLDARMRSEAESLQGMRETLRNLDRELFRRLIEN